MDKSERKNKNQTLMGKLSFASLIRFWEKEAAHNNITAAAFENIKKKLDEAPELLSPIEDRSIVEKNLPLIEELLEICLSPGIKRYDYFAAVYPDMKTSFYESPAFKKLGLFQSNFESTSFNENCCLTPAGKVVATYMILLNVFYGLNVSYEYPVIYTRTDEKSGLERHYRIRIFGWFSEIKVNGKVDPLNDNEKRTIIENLDNPDVLMKIIDPSIFEFEGFLIYNAVDITDLETLSSLKFDLIGKESILSPRKFENMQHKLRVLLKKPEIKLGLVAFPSEKKDMANAVKMGNSIIMQDSFAAKDIAVDCNIYSEIVNTLQVKIVYDIKDYGCSPKVEEALINSNIRNLLLAPLVYKDELIGILEIASSQPGDLNKVNTLKLKDVYPLFALCIESSLDDLNKSVQTVIKEKCTAIHPTVEWRFRDAAMKYINNLRNDIFEEMEDIVFENVIPFYGCSDVKDSSHYRNAAIQADLIENLNMAKSIISGTSSGAALPILEELSFRITGKIDELNNELSSSNEVDIINFIRNEIRTTFDFLRDSSPEAAKLIETYNKKLDPELGFLVNKRKEFEESILLINDNIAAELDIQQDKAQKIFPHYFEKYKTDGVEYNMYIGSSLVSQNAFNPMHYKSLRLWQLTAMCIIAKKCHELKGSLKIPLETTHLIFVQNAPITIKFLYDEKKFDVAGSYDIRHEIIKKRIDKALIKGTNERLVGPCKIAIVYSQESEAEEFKQYINFLRTKNYITGEAESLELADLQGVHGLKALRISVNNDMIIEKSSDENRYEQSVKSVTGQFAESSKN